MSLFPWRRPKRLSEPPMFPSGDLEGRVIRTGERLSLALFGAVLPPDEYLRRFYPGAPIPPLSQSVATARPLVASVNGGNWIARCDCGGRGVPSPGGIVFAETPVVFCLRCRNGGTGRGWRPVTLPPSRARAQIERVLLCRANAADQNWEPGESIGDLLDQNRVHGDPIPEVPNGLRNPD